MALVDPFSNILFNFSQGLSTKWLSTAGVLLPFNGNYAYPANSQNVNFFRLTISLPMNQSNYVNTSKDFLNGNYRGIAFSQSDIKIKVKLKKEATVPYTQLFQADAWWFKRQNPLTVPFLFGAGNFNTLENHKQSSKKCKPLWLNMKGLIIC